MFKYKKFFFFSKRITIVFSALIVLLMGNIFAYLVDKDSKTNFISAKSISIEIINDGYEEYLRNNKVLFDHLDNYKKSYSFALFDDESFLDMNNEVVLMLPNKKIDTSLKVKIPNESRYINSTKNTSGYVFIELIVPKVPNVPVYNDDGVFLEYSNELYKYETNSNWELIKITKEVVNIENVGNKTIEHRVYAYVDENKNLKTVLPDNETSSLFDSLSLVNYDTNNITSVFEPLFIKAYGIQSNLTKSDGSKITDKLEVFNILTKNESLEVLNFQPN